MLISKSYKYIECNSYDNLTLLNDMIIIDIFLCNVKYCFVTIYRPPKFTADSLADAINLNHIISQLSTQNKPIFVIGDFNCRNID